MQNFCFPMWSPYEKAKWYKRYTGDLSVAMQNGESITVQDNRYVFGGMLQWTESTSEEDSDGQPVNGLIVENGYLTIRTNSLYEISVGDLIELPASSGFGGLWIVTDGISVDCTYTPKKVQTYRYLPLSAIR